jgi:hypothetical protein
MKVIWYQRPGIALGFGLLHQLTKSSQEIFAIRIVSKYLAPVYPPGNNMVQGAGCVYSGLSGHQLFLSMLSKLCKSKYVKGVP